MMKTMVRFFVRYPIWANTIMCAILGFGVLSFFKMTYSFFPEMKPSMIYVMVPFPGASPTEVEEGIVLKIEENLEGIEGIERITSLSRENVGQVSIEVLSDADLYRVLADVKNAVDQISSFPVDAEKAIIYEQKVLTRVMSVVLYGNTSLFDLKKIAESFRDDLLGSEHISQVTFGGLPAIEFSVELSEEKLRRYGLTFSEVAQAIREWNLNISGGKIETDREELLIRSYQRSYDAESLRTIPVRAGDNGQVIFIGDIAEVEEKWEDRPDRVYYNGQNAVVLSVDKTRTEDILKSADAIVEQIEKFNDEHEMIKAVKIDDRTISLRARIQLLAKNGLIGLALVLLILGFFLNLRLAGWVSLGIPISFTGLFIVSYLAGTTINVISCFGMIVVIGILVDDGIVVGENIFSHYEKGASALQAAIVGTREMIPPVFTSVATTVIAFLPFFFLDGFLGKFIWNVAFVVIMSLVFSLVEAFVILPAHLAHSKSLSTRHKVSKIRTLIENAFQGFIHKAYAPVLKLALQHKWVTLVFPVFFLFMTVGLLKGRVIGVTFFPFIDGDTMPVNIALEPGTQEKQTLNVLRKIEDEAWKINEQLKKERPDGLDVIQGIKTEIGRNNKGNSGSHAGSVTLQLLPGEIRQLASFEIANRLRKNVGIIPEAVNTSFGRQGVFGKPVSISLLGDREEPLKRAKEELMEALSGMEQLKDTTDSSLSGRREIDIRLKPLAKSMGLTLRDVMKQVKDGFFGRQAQRIQRGRDEIRIWVRYRDEDRVSMGQLEKMRIRTARGEFPFNQLATYRVKQGVSNIRHLNKKKELKVESELKDVEASVPLILEEIETTILPDILAKYPSVRVLFEGQSRQQRKEARSMKASFPLAFISMFILVVLVFRSPTQAFLVFSLIPLAIMGAIWGHGIQGIKLNLLSIYGVIALTGIVVNDSIVLVDQINRNLRQGMKLFESVLEASISRFRPILLTTLTTVFGLAPLMLETSRQAQFLIPMATSVAYGLLFGTFILLFILPCGFLAINRVKVFLNTPLRGKGPAPESLEPAVIEMKSDRLFKDME
ncbi:MAG: hypothetical protein CR997_05350 [Acidobacteria bacterium]|nr:MAG: hypothetical protein CR997_05350 [Acidobacteriota bacterium]